MQRKLEKLEKFGKIWILNIIKMFTQIQYNRFILVIYLN